MPGSGICRWHLSFELLSRWSASVRLRYSYLSFPQNTSLKEIRLSSVTGMMSAWISAVPGYPRVKGRRIPVAVATLALPRQKVNPHSHSPATIRIIQFIISDVVLTEGCSNIRRLLPWTHKDSALEQVRNLSGSLFADSTEKAKP